MECDYWSIGIVAFMFLSGDLPFFASDLIEFLKLIKRNEFNFDGEVWETVSPEAKDFISRILVIEPTERLSFR